MRSVDSPRVLHDATVELGSGLRARSVNLSTSGIFVSSEEKLEKGEKVRLKVNMNDGAMPLDVSCEVVRTANDGMALRFVDLDDMSKQRIQRLVHKREPTGVGKRDVRIHLPSLSAPLRASARELNDAGVMIEADLPWLRLGSPVTAELSPERACDGHVSWIGLDVTRAGSARLRMFVDFSGDENGLVPPPAELINRGRSAHESQSLPPLKRRHLVWPAIAITALIAVGALATSMGLRPPRPTLLPTSPPEREEQVVKLPPRTVVPREGETPVVATEETSTPTIAAMPFGPPMVAVPATTSATANATATAAHGGKIVKKKHARAKRRVD
jgi:hypothetical protein